MAKEYFERVNSKTGTVTLEGRVVGRDRKVIPPEQVESLAEIGCRDREIADFFGIAENTLRYNFSGELIQGRERMKHSLRRAMLHNAIEKHNAALQIFLAKNMLGMSDNPSATQDQQPLPWSDDDSPATRQLSDEQREQLQQRLDEYNQEQLDQESNPPHGAQ